MNTLNSLLVLLQFVIVSLTHDDHREEMDKRRTSNVCRSSSECPQNSLCEPRGGGVEFMEGQCVCQSGYFMKASGKRRECIMIADYGELCFMNEQCEFRLGKESHCSNRQCACKQRAHYVVAENACFNSSKIGDYCRLTSNCAVDKTTCQQGQCRCHFGWHSNADKSRCLRDVRLNERCYADDECVVEHSLCESNACKCKRSHVSSVSNSSECLPLASSLYQSCQQDSQCASIANAVCGDNSTCECARDHHDINAVRIIKNSTPDDRLVTFEISFNFFQRCWSSVRLGGICESDENCVVAHSACVNKRCACEEGFSETREKLCSRASSARSGGVVVLWMAIALLAVITR